MSALPATADVLENIEVVATPLLEGTVTAGGQPVHGAMVTVFSEDRMRKETVFTDAQGHYRIVVGFAGELAVSPLETELERSNALPASAIEDGVPSFICVDPIGGRLDRHRAETTCG